MNETSDYDSYIADLQKERDTYYTNWQAAAAENRRLAGIEQDRDAYQEKAEIAEGMNVACGLVIKNLKAERDELKFTLQQGEALGWSAAFRGAMNRIAEVETLLGNLLTYVKTGRIAGVQLSEQERDFLFEACEKVFKQ